MLCLVLTRSLQLSASARVAYLFFYSFMGCTGWKCLEAGSLGAFHSPPALVWASPGRGRASRVLRQPRCTRVGLSGPRSCVATVVRCASSGTAACSRTYSCCCVCKFTGLFPTTSGLPLTPRDARPSAVGSPPPGTLVRALWAHLQKLSLFLLRHRLPEHVDLGRDSCFRVIC